MKRSIIQLLILSVTVVALCIPGIASVYGQTCPNEVQSEATIIVTNEQCFEAKNGQIEISFVDALGNYDPSLGDFTPGTGDYRYGLFDGGSEGGWVYDEANITPGGDVVPSISIVYDAPNKITFTGLPPNTDFAGYRIYIFGGDCNPDGREEFTSATFGMMVDPATEIIIDPAQISTTDNTTCVAPFDGEINMTGAVSGGAGGYQYSIDGGANFQTNPVFSGLEHNTYTITVIDQNSTAVGDNCTKTVDVTVNDGRSFPTASITPSNPTVCSGVDLLLNGNPADGTGVYTAHAWTGDTGPLSATNVVDPTFNATAGTYTLTYEVTDDKGCTATSSITITVNDSPTLAELSGDATICAGNSTDLVVTITDGVGPFSFDILDNTNATTFTVTNYNSGDAISVSPATTTTYSIDGAVTDINGCEVTGSGNAIVTVVDPSNVTLIIEAEETNICAGEATNIIVRGSENGYTYQLRNDADDSTIGTPVSGDGNDILLPTGNLSTTTIFNVLVSNGGLCPDTQLDNTASVTVTNAVDLTLPVSAQNNSICSGEATNILVDNSEVGVSYQLRNDADDSNVGPALNGTGGQLFFPTGALTTTTTYNIVASNGVCTDAELSASIIVSVNPTPTAAVLSGNATICAGTSTDLTIIITDGTEPFNFSISDGTNTFAVTNYTSGDAIPVSPIANTSYTINGLVTDANGCSVAGSGTVAITVNQGPTTASISGDVTLCEGESTDIQLTITGGQAPYNFTLSDGTTLSNYNSGSNISVSPASTTVYTVATVQDANGCEVVVNGSATVTINPLPTVFNSSPANLSTCPGDDATINLDGSQVGTDYELYLEGIATGVTVPGTGASISLTLNDGAFANGEVLTIRADNGNCSSFMNGSSTIDINTIQVFNLSPAALDVCSGEDAAVSLDGSENGVTYTLLTNGIATGVTANGTGAPISLTLTDGSFATNDVLTVSATRGSCREDMNGSSTITINTLTANAGADQTIVDGNSTTLSGSAADGSGAYTYAWSPVAQLAGPAEASRPNPTTANLNVTTVFTLTVTDVNTGCQSTDNITVTVTGGALSVTASATPATICAGESVTLNAVGSGGDGAYSYSWNNGAGNGQSPTVSPVLTTTYQVTITDGNGDTSTDQVSITVNPLPVQFTVSPDPVIVCSGTDAIIELDGSELDVTYTLFRNGAPTLVTVAGTGNAIQLTLASGNFSDGDIFTVQAVDDNTGCESLMNGSSTIDVNDPQTFAVTPTSLDLCTGEDATISLSGSENGTNYTVLLNGVALGAPVVGTGAAINLTLLAGSFANSDQVTVEADNGGCQVLMNGNTQLNVSTITAANAGTNDVTCTDSYALNANTVAAGETGTWTTTGSGTFADANDPTTTVSGLGLGANTLRWTISDNSGVCSSTTSEITITHREVTVANAGVNQAVCTDEATLAANPAAAGETGTWTLVSGTGTFDGNNHTTQVTGLSAGDNTFRWTISDNSGTCPATVSEVTITRGDLSADAGADQTIITGNSTLLSGSGTGGSATYTYHWEPAASLVDANVQNPTTVTLTATTIFTLTVDDGTCQSSDSVTVTVTGGPLSVTASATLTTICAGESVTLNAVGSGGDGNYTYSWNNGAGNVQSPTVSPMLTTSYQVIVTDGNGDTSTDQVSITVNPLPVQFTVSPDPVIVCSGTDAIIELDGSESDVTYELLRNNAPVGSLSPIAGTGNPLTITLPQGELSNGDAWTLRGESASGCTVMMLGQATIQISDPVVYAITTDPVLTICQGQDAIITLDNSDTSVDYILFADRNLITTSPGTGTSLDFVLADGSFADGEAYTIVADNGSCQVSMTGSVEIDLEELDATFSYASGTFCIDGDNPFPEPDFTPGGQFTSDSPGDVDVDSNTGEIILANSVARVNPYTIYYTLDNGACTVTKEFKVSLTNTSNATFSYDNTSTSYCIGSGTTDPILGPGASMGVFSASSPDLIIDASTGQININGSRPGNYTVTNFIAGSGSCPDASHSVNVQILEQEIADVTYASPFCQSDATDPVPTINGTTGGRFSTTDPISIDPDNGAIDLSASTPGGPYIITYTTPGTCSDTQDVSITINPAADATFSYASNEYCTQDPALAVLPDALATPGGMFSASPAGLDINTNTGEINLAGSVANTYDIEYTTNEPGCNSTETFRLTIYDVVADAGPDESACTYDYTLQGNDPGTATGEWTVVSTPSGTAIVTFTNYTDHHTEVTVNEPGIYEFQWEVTQGSCSATDHVAITFAEPLPIATGRLPTTGCAASDGFFSVSSPVGSGTFSYIWSAGVGQPFLLFGNQGERNRDLPGGVHSVRVTNQDTQCDTLVVFNIPNGEMDGDITITHTDNTCNGANNGAMELSSSKNRVYNITYTDSLGVAHGPIAYDNTSGTAVATIPGLAGGTYYVEIEDTNNANCKTGKSVSIGEVPPLTVVVDNITDASCVGVADGSLQISVSGGAGPYIYSWKDTNGIEVSTDEDPTSLIGGDYTVDITYNGGTCTMTFGTYTVPAPPAAAGPAAHIPFSADILCNSFLASWSDQGVTEYRIDVATDASFTAFVVTDQVVNATSYTVSGLTTGTDYFYRVRSVDGAGCVSQNSDPVQVRTDDVAAPTALTNTAPVSCEGFVARWNAVTGATDYEVEVVEAANPTVAIHNSGLLGGGVTEYAVDGLSKGQTYLYRVRVTASCGTSDYSNNVSVTTQGLADALADTDLSANPACTSAEISWRAIAGVSRYEVFLDTDNDFDNGTSAGGPHAIEAVNTTTSINGLIAETPYFYHVLAILDCDTTSAVGSFVTRDTPESPVVSATNPTCNGFTLDWTAVADADEYIVRITDGTRTAADTITAMSLTFDTLSVGTTYDYEVVAVGCTESTPAIGSFTTNDTPGGLAVPPTASNPSCLGFTVSWTSEVDTRYLVEASPASDNFTTAIETSPEVNGDSFTFTTLSVDTEYAYRVISINDCGTGDTTNAASTIRTNETALCGCGHDYVSFIVTTSNATCPGSEDGVFTILGRLKSGVTVIPDMSRFKYKYQSLTNPADTSAWETGMPGPPPIPHFFSGVKAGDYEVFVWDTLGLPGCEDTISFTATISLQNQITAVTKAATCDTPGEIAVTIPGTCSTQTLYSVNEVTGEFSSVQAGNDWVFAELPAGDYQIAVSDFSTGESYDTLSLTVPNNCSGGADTTFTVCNLNGITFLPETTLADCETGEGSVTFTALNGSTETFTFTVVTEEGVVFETKEGSSGITFDNLPEGRYIYGVYDALAQSCQGRFTVGTKSVKFTTDFTLPACNAPNQVTDLTVIVDTAASVAAAPYRITVLYRTETVATQQVPVGSRSAIISGLPIGRDYQVVVQPTAANTCVGTKDVFIGAPGFTAIDFTYRVDSAACFADGGSVTISDMVVADGEPFTINLYDVEQTTPYATRIFNVTPATFTFGNLPNGQYQVQVVQQQSGCATAVREKRSGTFVMEGPESTLTASVRSYVEVTVNYPYGTIEIDSIVGGGAPYEVRIAADPMGGTTDWVEVINENPIVRPYRHEYRDMPVGTYVLELRDRFGCHQTFTVEVGYTSELYIPNIFTPNGDGDNDTFYILNLENYGENAGIQMKITNRWGRQIYRSGNYTNVEAWNGGNYPDGVYFYHMILPDNSEHTGWVEIWRGRTP